MLVTQTNPTDFINSLPDESREALTELDKLITSCMPDGTSRVMWEGKFWGGSEQKIIGYGDLTYVGSNKKEVKWFAVGLAQQKDYITVFVSPEPANKYQVEEYKDEIGKAKVGKSTISFKKVTDINLEKLKEVVEEAFRFMSEN